MKSFVKVIILIDNSDERVFDRDARGAGSISDTNISDFYCGFRTMYFCELFIYLNF